MENKQVVKKKKSTTKIFRKLLSKKELNVARLCNKKMITKIARYNISF